MPDAIRDLLHPATRNVTAPTVEARPVDTEVPRAMSLQLRWLALPAVRARCKTLGWNAPIHHNTRVTYRDVRDFPRYNWHKWMQDQIKEASDGREDSRRSLFSTQSR